MSRLVIFWLLGAAACSAQQSGESKDTVSKLVTDQHAEDWPTPRTIVEVVNGKIIFRFDVCLQSDPPVQLSDVTVSLGIEHGRRPDPRQYCRIHTTGGKSIVQIPSAGWEYGQTLPNVALWGDCPPLVPNAEYSVGVLAQGLGGARFIIDDSGALHVSHEECEELKAKQQLKPSGNKKGSGSAS